MRTMVLLQILPIPDGRNEEEYLEYLEETLGWDLEELHEGDPLRDFAYECMLQRGVERTFEEDEEGMCQ